MKNFAVILSVILTLFAFVAKANGTQGNKILIIASNLQDMGDPEKHDARNNLWEYAPPYHVFVSHGYEIDIASPKGGSVPFMMDPIGISSYTIKYEGFLDKTEHSLAPGKIDSRDYAAVFIGGGYGILFDVATNKKLQKIISEIYENGGYIGGCGHGPGAFADVKLSDGSFMVSGKRVAGFPNSTEKEKSWAKQGTLLPFLVEDRLRGNGAIVINKDNVRDKNDVISDQRIVSTMFLPSAALVAKEMLILLKEDTADDKSPRPTPSTSPD